VIKMSTISGVPPSTSTETRVISSTSFFFCSTVRPSIISMWYVGMGMLLRQKNDHKGGW